MWTSLWRAISGETVKSFDKGEAGKSAQRQEAQAQPMHHKSSAAATSKEAAAAASSSAKRPRSPSPPPFVDTVAEVNFDLASFSPNRMRGPEGENE